MTDAERHEQLAHEHERAAVHADNASETYDCGNVVLNDQLTSGGQRLTAWTPCWDIKEETAQHHRDRAGDERRRARRERRGAAQLLAAEQLACAGITPNERAHSPFAHRKEIVEVIPHSEDGRLRGAWIVFARVPGLTTGWLERDVACQHARWVARGYDPSFAPEDPTLLDGVHVAIHDHDGRVEVLITADTPEQAAIVLARARGDLGADVHTAAR